MPLTKVTVTIKLCADSIIFSYDYILLSARFASPSARFASPNASFRIAFHFLSWEKLFLFIHAYLISHSNHFFQLIP